MKTALSFILTLFGYLKVNMNTSLAGIN